LGAPHVAEDFVEEGCGTYAKARSRASPKLRFCDRVIGGQMLDRFGGRQIDEDGVELEG
jgi:hypothetical protein